MIGPQDPGLAEKKKNKPEGSRNRKKGWIWYRDSDTYCVWWVGRKGNFPGGSSGK